MAVREVDGPLSKSLHRLHTEHCESTGGIGVPCGMSPSLWTTAAVQLLNPLQYPVGEFASAASKKGCGVTAAALPAQRHRPEPFTPPQYCKHHILIRLGELLPAHPSSCKHRVQVNGLVLMGDSAPDVAQFNVTLRDNCVE